MIVAYASLTGNVRRFITNLDGFERIEISSDTVINSPFVLITYTTGKGQTPREVVHFLERGDNSKNLKGVIGSGNRNWGRNFCKGAKSVSNFYNVPLIHEFEMSGSLDDISVITDKLKELKGRCKIDKMDTTE